MNRLLLKDIKKLFTLKDGEVKPLEGYSILVEDERIKRIDLYENLKTDLKDEDIYTIDCSENTVLPGFVDPHTHLVFGGDRKEEYLAKLTLTDKEEIEEKIGGVSGMVSSVNQTKDASFEELFDSSMEKLEDMLINGTTTVEIKSGYGIDKDVELKQLRVVKELKEKAPQTIVATYLGGHDWDKEMGKDKYLDFMIEEVMPIIEKEDLADLVDIWVEDVFFSVEQGRKYLKAGMKMGMPGTIHGNELSSIGAAGMAAEEGAYSVAHLNYITDEEIEKMKDNDTVGIVLPTTDYVKQYLDVLADGRKFIDKGLRVAIATNLNPGNFTVSMPLCMNMACRNHGLTAEEALKAATYNGAYALHLLDDVGSIEEGKFADIQIWETDDYRDVIYKQGMNYVDTVIKKGEILVRNKELI